MKNDEPRLCVWPGPKAYEQVPGTELHMPSVQPARARPFRFGYRRLVRLRVLATLG